MSRIRIVGSSGLMARIIAQALIKDGHTLEQTSARSYETVLDVPSMEQPQYSRFSIDRPYGKKHRKSLRK